jgi:peptidoglycan/LPS O-acetylase OafA/YrhL
MAPKEWNWLARTRDPAVQPHSERLQTLDALRGLAALAVVWFHFSRFTPAARRIPLLTASGKYGWIGVEVFFVISGFVIPLALHKGQYRLGDFPRFLAKRLIRLEPPYLASIIITLLMRYLLHWGRGQWGMPSAWNLFLHPFYLNGVFREYWLISVYWTLAVELQFYLLIGLAFPLVRKPALFWMTAAPVAVALAFALPYQGQIFFYLPCFLLGIATFHLSTGGIDRLPFFGFSFALAAIALKLLNPFAVLAAVGTALAIAFVRRVPRVLVWLGAISYPLYLLHVPVSYTALTIAGRLGVSSLAWVYVIAGASALFTAWLLHLLIELPAQRWSSKIRYVRGETEARNSTVTKERVPLVVQQTSAG